MTLLDFDGNPANRESPGVGSPFSRGAMFTGQLAPATSNPRGGTPRGRATAARMAKEMVQGGPDATTLKMAQLKFDANHVMPQDGSWRAQNLLRSRSPRLMPVEARPASLSEGLAALQGKSNEDIVQMLLDNDLNTATFVEFLQQQQHSPTLLIPWLHTLAALASKVGLLLESTRFLTCDLQLARVLLHMQLSAKSLCGAKRAHAFLVRSANDEILKVGDRGEVLSGASESLANGTSFAAHCARGGKPQLIGLPGSPHRGGLQFNVDTGTGCRPETSLCVPCVDHLGNVLAVIQVVDKQTGGSFGRDDVVLLQRFAVQCGISLRNAGGTTYSATAAPTGEMMSPRNGGPASSGHRPRSLPRGDAAEAGGRTSTHTPARRAPRTSDHACQCDLFPAPPLQKLRPLHVEKDNV